MVLTSDDALVRIRLRFGFGMSPPGGPVAGRAPVVGPGWMVNPRAERASRLRFCFGSD
jgi:hypothetical protein